LRTRLQVERVSTRNQQDPDGVGDTVPGASLERGRVLAEGSLNWSTQSQFVTGSRTTSPVSHNPGLADRPALAYSSALGCPGASPVARRVESVPTMRAPTISNPIFNGLITCIPPADCWIPRQRAQP
jgi:hypothetical protein